MNKYARLYTLVSVVMLLGMKGLEAYFHSPLSANAGPVVDGIDCNHLAELGFDWQMNMHATQVRWLCGQAPNVVNTASIGYPFWPLLGSRTLPGWRVDREGPAGHPPRQLAGPSLAATQPSVPIGASSLTPPSASGSSSSTVGAGEPVADLRGTPRTLLVSPGSDQSTGAGSWWMDDVRPTYRRTDGPPTRTPLPTPCAITPGQPNRSCYRGEARHAT